MVAAIASIKRELMRYRFSLAARPHRAALVEMIRWRVGTVFDAEDIVQVALLKAYVKWMDAGGESFPAFPYWLRMVAFNTMKDHFRRLKAANAVEFDVKHRSRALGHGNAPSALQECMAAQQQEIFLRAIDRLPEELRHPLILREIELLEFREVGEALGIAVGTAHRRVTAARAALLREFGELDS